MIVGEFVHGPLDGVLVVKDDQGNVLIAHGGEGVDWTPDPSLPMEVFVWRPRAPRPGETA